MKKKLLFLIICLTTFNFSNANKLLHLNVNNEDISYPVIGIIGDATPGGWNTDTDMTTTDGITYNLTGVTLNQGAIKFRQDHAWTPTTNWGGATFPSGTGVLDGAAITIPSTANYDITFNLTTGAYSFAVSQVSFQVISIFGDATPGAWTTDTDMNTTDGTTYTLKNVALVPGALKFRGDHAWTLPYNWGGTAFPSGTAVVDANGISIPTAGLYNITFNKVTGVYSFSFQTISIFGDATPGAWVTDTDMTTTDGTTYTLNNVALVPGALKFRGDHAWTLPYNWGGTAFPSGTAVVDANGISVPTTGNYNITFNKVTGAYSIAIPSVNYPVIGIIGDATPGGWTTDTDMTTTNGITYTISGVVLNQGAIKFRQDHAWTATTNWGGTTFPSGTGILDGAAITIPSTANYDITFNLTTGAYSFSVQQVSYPIIGLIGDATAGGWSTDTDMTTTDGVNYKIDRVVLVAGYIKFRQDHTWTPTTNWGGNSFSNGTGILDGPGINVINPGTYNVQFNKTTGVYSFYFLPVAIVGDGAGGWPTGASGEVDAHPMNTIDGVNYSLTNFVLTDGYVKFRGNNSWALPFNWGGTDFQSGIAVVDGGALASVAGTYNINININTGVYSFVIPSAPSELNYTTPNLFITGTPITNLVPTYHPGLGNITFTVSPALPSGLSIDATTGVISGTPSIINVVSNYTISATNSYGSSTKRISIEIQGKPSGLSYSGNLRLPINITMASVVPTVSSSPAPVYTINPALPSGISLNPSTGEISGRPTLETSAITYTVTATNTHGSATKSFTIEVFNEDHDFDGVLDVSDNCPTTYNQDQSDIDHDGIGDSCDLEEINVAQGFSPNGDGKNDTWFINNIVNHPNSSVRVFNKIGSEVYYSKDYQNDWDGEYKNTGEKVAAGSYFYQIDLGGDGSIDKQGWIYIAK